MKLKQSLLIIIVFLLYSNSLLSEDLRVIYPNGGNDLIVDSVITIKWEATDPNVPVTIEYSFDYGVAWNIIEDEYIGSELEWKVPPVVSKECLIKVYSAFSASDIVWQKSYGGKKQEHAHEIKKTDDGGYIVAGFITSLNDDVGGLEQQSDFWILKLDELGEKEWEKVYGGSNGDKPTSIHQLPDGGYIVAGYTTSTDGDLSYRTDYGFVTWVVRLDKLGNMIWNKIYGTNSIDFSRTLELTDDGGFIIWGITDPKKNSNGTLDYSDYHILKLDEEGTIEWEKIYGGGNIDNVYSIIQTDDKGYIVTGYTDDSDVGNNNGSYVLWVLKLYNNGEIEWEKSYGGTNDDYANGIIQTTDGGYIILSSSFSRDGDISNYNGSKDILVIKISSNGLVEWSKNYGGSNIDIPFSIKETKEGNFVIAGCTQSNDGDIESFKGIVDAWTFEIDNMGKLIWNKSFGGSGSEYFYSLELAEDGDIVFAGFTNSSDGDVVREYQYDDIWIVKYNPYKKVFLSDQSDSLFSIRWYDIKDDDDEVSEDKFHFTVLPNVTSTDVAVSLYLETEQIITLELFDNIGRRMETILSGVQPFGLLNINLDLSPYSSGRYYLRLITPKFNITKKIELLN